MFRIVYGLVFGVLLLVVLDRATAQDENAKPEASDKQVAKPIPTNPFPDAVAMPPGILDGGSEWLNTSQPLDLKDLRGKIVLLDFWTYCCINCIHVLPDLKYLEEKYKNELVVIGVHSAKFDNEKLSANIRDAILRYEIEHPVVNDDEMLIWRKFGTRSWPTLALVDPEGNFAGSQGGEGNRELFDNVIGKMVEYHRWKGTLDEKPMVFDLEASKAKPTSLRYPGKILADAESGRLFISDSNHNRIVITDLEGQHLDTIGRGQPGAKDGGYSSAEFDHPQGMELVGDLLYVADTENHLLRVVDLQAKTVTTLAGTGVQGRPRVVDGSLSKTNLNSPWALCHIDGVLFIAMAGPHQIWSHKLGTQKIGVHAGSAREDVVNGRLPMSAFAQPSGLTPNADGSAFYVADSEGSSIRKVPVNRNGTVTTLAGTFELARGQSLFAFGDVDATGANARFQHPLGVAFHDGFVFVADSYNHKIRKVNASSGEVTTWLGNGKSGTSLSQLSEPAGLSIANGKLYIADTNNHRILTADLATREVQEIAVTDVTPPKPRKTRRVPSLDAAEVLGQQVVGKVEAINVMVELSVPLDGKLNDLAPVTYEVFLIEGDQLVSPAGLEGRATATVADGVASFSIPLSQEIGTATMAIQISYGYCKSKTTDLCSLASGLWKIPLQVSADSDNVELKLIVPAVDNVVPEAGINE